MRTKNLILLAILALFSFGAAGCAQDSTNTTDDNPAQQELNMQSEEGASKETGTDTTRSDAMGGTDATKLTLVADKTGALKFNTDKLNANAGNIDITLDNESSVTHNVEVTAKGGKVLGTSEDVSGGDTTLDLKDVKAGTYTFFCDIPGHRQAGMEGTLTVR